MRSRKVSLAHCLFAFLALLLPCSPRAQAPAFSGMETATQDRLEDTGWWPTKGTAARASFAGQESCARCHASQASTQSSTPMGSAARRASDREVLRSNAALTFVSAPHTFSITSTAAGSSYTVTDGKETLARQLDWVFGSGHLGQTFLYQFDDRWYESQVSFYTGLRALDLTTGHTAKPDASLRNALGKELQPLDVQHCFQCHTTLAMDSGRFEPQKAVAGLKCEACHGPGKAHAVSMEKMTEKNSIGTTQSGDLGLLDLERLSPVDSVDFCGACHRTWADIAFSPQANRASDVVRFQPYRLEKSRCWGKNGDERITCVACHNPHKPLERNTAVYDEKCLACHAVHAEDARNVHNLPGKACPVSRKDCTTCHMPKVNVATMHGEFTDHWIRVVKAGAVLPQ